MEQQKQRNRNSGNDTAIAGECGYDAPPTIKTADFRSKTKVWQIIFKEKTATKSVANFIRIKKATKNVAI